MGWGVLQRMSAERVSSQELLSAGAPAICVCSKTSMLTYSGRFWPVQCSNGCFISPHGQAWSIEVEWSQSANRSPKDAWVDDVDTLHAKHTTPNFLRLLTTSMPPPLPLNGLIGVTYDYETQLLTKASSNEIITALMIKAARASLDIRSHA